MKNFPKIRLFVETNLRNNTLFSLNENQSHYLQNVMKQNIGNIIRCFDNASGEYDCEIIACGKKRCDVKVLNKTKDYYQCPDIWLLFAPVKKEQTDFIIQKATELGVRKIVPTITERTISDKVKKERFILQTIEACEQCRRVDVPEVCDAITLDKLLANWDKSCCLYFMDETGKGENITKIFSSAPSPLAILVGPEGGFSEKELEKLRNLPYTKAVVMGKRILRAETAVVAALSCWQAMSGDWSD